MAEMIKFRVGIGAQLNAKDIENQLKAQKSEVMEQVRKSLEKGEKPKIDFGFDIDKDSGISDADVKKFKSQCEKQVNNLIDSIMKSFGDQMTSSITSELTKTVENLFDKLGETMINSFESMKKDVVNSLSGKPIQINTGDIVDIKTDKGKTATQVKKAISDNVKAINKEADKAYEKLFDRSIKFDGKSFTQKFVEDLRGDEKELDKISKNFFSTVEKVAQAYKEAKAQQDALADNQPGLVVDPDDDEDLDYFKSLYDRVKKSGKKLKSEMANIIVDFGDIDDIDEIIKKASKAVSFDEFVKAANSASEEFAASNEKINQQVSDLEKILARLEYAYQKKWVSENEMRSIFDMKKYFGVDTSELRSASEKAIKELLNENDRISVALQKGVKSGELFSEETDLMNFDIKTLQKNILTAIKTIRKSIKPIELPFTPEPESVGNFAETLLNKVQDVFDEGIPIKAKLINEDELREQLEGISGLNINVNANVNGVTQSGDVAITTAPSSNQGGGIRRISEDDILAGIPMEDIMNAMNDGADEYYDSLAKVNYESDEAVENISQMAKGTDAVAESFTHVEKKAEEVKKTASEIADILLKNVGVENVSTINKPLEDAKEELEILQNVHDLRRKSYKYLENNLSTPEKELLYEDIVTDRKLNPEQTKRLTEIRSEINKNQELVSDISEKVKSKTHTEDDIEQYKKAWKEIKELQKEEEALIHIHTKRKRELTDTQKKQLESFEKERLGRAKLVQQWHELSETIEPASTAVREYEAIQEKLIQKQKYEDELNKGLFLQPSEQEKYDELKAQNLEEALIAQEKVVESAKQELEVRKQTFDLFGKYSTNALIGAYQKANNQDLTDSNVIKQAESAIQRISSSTMSYSTDTIIERSKNSHNELTQYEKSYARSIESSNSALKNQLHSLNSNEEKWKHINELVSKHGVSGAISYLENKTTDLDKALGRVNNRIAAKRLSGADYTEDEGLRNTLQSQKKANGYYLSELKSLTKNVSSEEVVKQQIALFEKEATSAKENFHQLISTTKGKNQALDDLRHKDIKSHKEYLDQKESLERLSTANSSYQKQIEERTLEYSKKSLDELEKRAKKIASEQKDSGKATKQVQNMSTKQELASYIATNEVYSGSEDASNIRASLERKKKQIQNYETDMNEIIMLINRIAENPTGENVTAYKTSLETLIQRAGVTEIDIEGYKKYQDWLTKQKSQNAKKSNIDIPKIDVKDYEKGTSSIQEVVDNLDKDIKEVEDKNAKLNSSLSQMTETATKIRGKITEKVDAEVKTVDDDIANLKAEISKLNDAIKETNDPLEEQILREEKGALSAKLTHKERLKNEFDREREIDRIYEKDNRQLIENISHIETELYLNNQKLEQLKAIREEQEKIRKEKEPTVADIDEQKKQSTKDYSAQKKILTNQLTNLQAKLVEKEEEFVSTTLSESEKKLNALQERLDAEQKALDKIVEKHKGVSDETAVSKVIPNVGGIDSQYTTEYQKYISSVADETSAQKVNQQRAVKAQEELNLLMDKYSIRSEESLKSEVEKQITVAKLLELYDKINKEQKSISKNNDLLMSYVSEMESIASEFGIDPGKLTKIGQSYEYKFKNGYSDKLSAMHDGSLSKLSISKLESLLSQIQKLTSGEQSVVTNADALGSLQQEDTKLIRDNLESIRQKYVEILKAKLEEQKVGLNSSNVEEQNQALVNTLKLTEELRSVAGYKSSTSILSGLGIDESTLKRAKDLINEQNTAERNRARNQKDYNTQKDAEISRQQAVINAIEKQIADEKSKLEFEQKQIQAQQELIAAKQVEIDVLEQAHKAELKSLNDKKKEIANASQSATASKKTPVSSDTTAVEKVKENLKEVEVQAEKTEQAVKEAVNVPSNESTLSKEKEQIAEVTAEVQKQEQAVEELVDAKKKLDVHALTGEQKSAIGKVLNDIDASKSNTYVSKSDDIVKELLKLNEEFDGQLVRLIRDKCQSVLEYTKKSTNKDEKIANNKWLNHMRQSIIPTVEATLAYQGLSPELKQKIDEKDNDLDAVIQTWILSKLNGVLESEALFNKGKNVTGIQIGGKDFSKASADKYDTWFQTHADGMGVFSPSDFQRLESDWKKGLRKFQLLVDGSLHEIDFSGIKKAPKTLAMQFVKEFETEYKNLTKGLNSVEDVVVAKNQAFTNVINRDAFSEIKYTIRENYIDTMKKAGEVAEQVSEQIAKSNKEVKTAVSETTSVVNNTSPLSPTPSSSPSVPTDVNITGISNTSGLATEAMQKEILTAINGTIKVTGDVNVAGGTINIGDNNNVQMGSSTTTVSQSSIKDTIQDTEKLTQANNALNLSQKQVNASTIKSEKVVKDLAKLYPGVAKAIKKNTDILGERVNVVEQMRLAPGEKEDEKIPWLSLKVTGETGNSITFDPYGEQLNHNIKLVDDLTKSKETEKKVEKDLLALEKERKNSVQSTYKEIMSLIQTIIKAEDTIDNLNAQKIKNPLLVNDSELEKQSQIISDAYRKLNSIDHNAFMYKSKKSKYISKSEYDAYTSAYSSRGGTLDKSSDAKRTVANKEAVQREKIANDILKEEIKSVEKLSKFHAELQTRKAQGKDVEVIKEKIKFEREHLGQLKEEMLLYSDTESARSSYSKLKEVGQVSSRNVKQAYTDSNLAKIAAEEKEINNARRKEYQEVLRNYESGWKQFYKIQGNMRKANPSSFAYEQMEIELDQLFQKQMQLYNKAISFEDVIKTVRDDLINIDNKLEASGQGTYKVAKASAEARDSAISTLDKKLEGYNKKLFDFDAVAQRADTIVPSSLTEKLNEVQQKMLRIQEIKNAIGDKSKFLNEQDLQNSKDELNNIYSSIEKIFTTIAKDNAYKEVRNTAVEKLDLKMADWLKTNTIASEFRNTIKQLRVDLRNVSSDADIKKIAEDFMIAERKAKDAGKEGKNFFDLMITKSKHLSANFAAQYLSLMDIVRYLRTGIETIRELDYALVDLQKTTSMNVNELNEFYFEANDVAKQLGVTTKEIIDQASAWSRLGFSTKEASTEMAKLSSQFAAISPGMDIDTATDGLVSSMKAFGIEVEDVERKIMDNINRIGNTAATDNSEIVDMLTRSSAAMAVANNTIEETIALETAA